MESKTRLILRHTSGLFLSWSPDEYPHTKKLSRARRFYSAEEVADFLSHSHYKPDHPEEYEIVEMDIEYHLKEDSHERMQTSLHAGLDGRTQVAHENG